MEDLRKLPLDVRLSALLDGELSKDEKEELERLIATDADARQLFDRLKRGSEIGNRAFDDLLKEPVPLALVRKIKNAPPPREASKLSRLTRPSFSLSPSGPQALAASIILFLLGGGIGYMAGVQPGAPQVAVQTAQAPVTAAAATRTWLDDIAAYHRVYSRQQRHLAEVPASESDHIVTWLTSSVGVDFKLPDLASQGLDFQGARLLVADGKPVAQLLYRTTDNDIIAICFMKNAADPAGEAFDETIKDDIGMVSWHRGAASYVVVGPSSEAGLTKIAEKASTEI